METKCSTSWSSCGTPRLSVVMLGFRRADLLAVAIESFLRHNSVKDWELVLVLNGASSSVIEYADKLVASADFPLLAIIATARRPGAARNLGVARARGEVIFFLDDDTETFQDIGGAALELFRDPEMMAAGGANLTPPGSTALQRAAGYVLGSALGTASMRGRYRQLPEGESGEHSLILCNLAVRKSAFFAEGGFATHLISNEENVLLQQLERGGHKLWRSPRLAVFHLRRSTWKGTWEQAVKYGSGRAQNLLLLPHTISALYFLPSSLLIYLLALLLLPRFPGSTIPIMIYSALVTGFALSFSVRYRDKAALLTLALFPWIHLAYGFGFASAMFRWGMKRKKLLEHAF